MWALLMATGVPYWHDWQWPHFILKIIRLPGERLIFEDKVSDLPFAWMGIIMVVKSSKTKSSSALFALYFLDLHRVPSIHVAHGIGGNHSGTFAGQKWYGCHGNITRWTIIATWSTSIDWGAWRRSMNYIRFLTQFTGYAFGFSRKSRAIEASCAFLGFDRIQVFLWRRPSYGCQSLSNAFRARTTHSTSQNWKWEFGHALASNYSRGDQMPNLTTSWYSQTRGRRQRSEITLQHRLFCIGCHVDVPIEQWRSRLWSNLECPGASSNFHNRCSGNVGLPTSG